MNKIFFIIKFAFFFFSIFCFAGQVYYVSSKGDNQNDGKTPITAWKTLDRGQPTYLRQDTKQGDSIIYVARAVQFPEKGRVMVGESVVEYSGKTADSLLNCKGTPSAKKNTKVISLDWDYPKPGDRIIVMEGVYMLKEKFSPDNKEWAGGINSVFAITCSGSEEQPIIIEGQGKAIIDGEFNKKSIFIRANNIKIKNLYIRRGGIYTVFSKNVEILENKVYYGIHSIYVRYSEKINIVKNFVYDFHGAWTDPGISVGDSKEINILNNTLVNNKIGISIWGNTENILIKNNLIAWNGLGISIDEKVKIEKENIKDNLLWANGNVIWLTNLQKPDTSEGKNHYKGLSFEPEDIYHEPKIVSWYSDSKNFLLPHKDSVCFSEGKYIGAGGPSEYEKRYDYKEKQNILFNGSFEFGFYGWKGTSWWEFNQGEAVWEIKEDDCYHGKKSLYLRESPQKDRRSAPRVTSVYFPINRGVPYTLSFYAKGKGNLSAGFAVPSWHDGSTFNKTFQLTSQWKRYSFTIKLPDYAPDWVAVRFGASWSEAYIDKVIVVEGENDSDQYDQVEIFYKNSEYGLLPPNGILPLLINYYSDKKEFSIKWEIISPFGEIIDKGSFDLKGEEEIDLRIKARDGIYLFKYLIEEKNQNIIKESFFRFAIGNPINNIKNKDFIAATPPYKHYSSINDFEKMVKKLSAYGIGVFHLYAGIERMKEMIDEDYFDSYLSIANKYKINYLVTIDNGNFSKEVNEENLDDFKTYVSKIVKKFKGRIKYYEILNEPNCSLKSGEEYIRILQEIAPIIKKIDSKAFIIAGSVVNAFGTPFYNKILQIKPNSFDFFSFHPYRFGIINPEIQGPFRQHIRMVKQDLRINFHKEKVWLTEEGMGPGYERTRGIGTFFSYSHPIYSNYFTEDELLWTQFATRMYLTAFGEGADGYNYHTLPILMVDQEVTPTLLLKALHTIATILGNSYPEDFLEIDEKYIIYIFSEKDRKIIVAWDKDSEWALETEISMPYIEGIKIYNMFGREKDFEKKDNLIKWKFDRYVNYIIFPMIPLEKLKEILKTSFSQLSY